MFLCFITVVFSSVFFLQTPVSADEFTQSDSISKSATIIPEITLVDTASDVIVPPVLLRFVNAAYPDSLIAKGVEGIVLLDLLIDTLGHVDSVAIVKGFNRVLDSAAVYAALRFSFSSACLDTTPVPVILQYAYRFSIDDLVINMDEQVNFAGVVLEKGTKTPVPNTPVALTFADTGVDSSQSNNKSRINVVFCNIPLVSYLKKIGGLSGQQFESGQLVTLTDSLGRFAFKAVPYGMVGVTIVVPGYKHYVDRIMVKPAQLTSVSLYLTNQHYNDFEIVVYGKKEEPEVTYHSISGQEVRHLPGFNGEAIKVVQALPGVSRPMFGQNDLIIRGASNGDCKILYDGISLPYLYHEATPDFGLYRSIVNGDALNTVSLFAGGTGVRYGNVVGGVVDLTSRPARLDRMHATVDINLKGYSLLIETPLTKEFSIIGSLRGSLFSYVMDFIQRNIAHERVDYVQNNFDYSLRLDCRLFRNHQVMLEMIGAEDTIALPQPAWMTGRKLLPGESVFTSSRKFMQGIAGWDWTINPTFKNTLHLGLRNQYQKSSGNPQFPYAREMQGNDVTFDFREELTAQYSRSLTATAGIDLHLTPYDVRHTMYLYDTTYTDSISVTLGQVGGYCLATWTLFDNLTITPGLRYDWYPALTYRGVLIPEFWNYKFLDNTTRFSGDPTIRVAAKYKIDKCNVLTASIGTYSQSPDTMAIMLTDKNNLSSKKGSQFTIGYNRQLTELLSLDLEAYFNQQWDIFRYTTVEERMADPDVSYWKCDGQARITGLELMLRHDRGRHFSGWLSYSLAYAQRYDFQDHQWALYDYNVLNNIQLIGQWALPLDNSIGMRLQYTDGYPYTPRTVKYYYATYFYYITTSGDKNSKQYPPYIGVDLNYSKKWVYKRSIVTTYIEFIRLLHILQYVKDEKGAPLYLPSEYYRYNYDFSSFEGIALWPMVSFGLTWEF